MPRSSAAAKTNGLKADPGWRRLRLDYAGVLLTGAAVFAAFLWHEAHTTDPMLPAAPVTKTLIRFSARSR